MSNTHKKAKKYEYTLQLDGKVIQDTYDKC